MINRLEGDSEKVIRRSLSNETKELLLPLAGRDNQVRIRLFQPNGELYADTRSLSQLSPKVEVFRLPKLTDNIKNLSDRTGFRANNPVLEIHGLCNNCSTNL